MRRIFAVLVGDRRKWISVFSIYCNNGVRWKISEPSSGRSGGLFSSGKFKTMAERKVASIKGVRPSHMTFYFKVGAAMHDVAENSVERRVGEVMPSIENAKGMDIGAVNVPEPHYKCGELNNYKLGRV